MQTLQTEIVPPKASTSVKVFDEKLVPVLERRTVLEKKVSGFLAVLNPHRAGSAPSERDLVEARLSLPQAQVDLARTGLDIADLERQRAETLKAEQKKVEEELDRLIGEEVAQLRRDFEAYIRPRNQRIHNLEELKEKLTGRQVYDRFCWWEFLDETATHETRWGLWTRAADDRFGYETPKAEVIS